MRGKPCMIYVTASGREEAEKIADGLVSAKLAACVNIYDGVTSIYRWEGKKQKDTECALIIKTKQSLFSEAAKKVKELHSYSCPCILCMDVSEADESYAKWIAEETA
jgi:periplasmic divalent cation tolerance protein